MKTEAVSSPNFAPLKPVVFISSSGNDALSISDIKSSIVGEKAFGLACIPDEWTLPFAVISKDLINQCKASTNDIDLIVDQWIVNVRQGAALSGIVDSDTIIVRSSGCLETITEHGKFYSCYGDMAGLSDVIKKCVHEIINDQNTSGFEVPLVLQRYSAPALKGHLSNEKRHCKEGRDWVVEIDDEASPLIRIALRNWREKVNVSKFDDKAIRCKTREDIKDALKVPAAWAHAMVDRMHLEWVWDGNRIFIVQADKASVLGGEDPTDLKIAKKIGSSVFAPVCLKPISEEHSRYHKIKNVLLYRSLGLPSTDLYVLEDQIAIKALSEGGDVPNLEADLSALVINSLVVRIDILTDSQSARQMLPRTHEIREVKAVIGWLQENTKKVLDENPGKEIALIFHNFMPAVSSAFVYASPGVRKVQVEALWGIPEGLYYFAHDKYVVDTFSSDLSRIDETNLKKFKIERRIRSKYNFVAPNVEGRWTSQVVTDAFYWKSSIQKDEWITAMALQSRMIAEKCGHPVSIMWFVGVPKSICESQFLPWFHEKYEIQKDSKAPSRRANTPKEQTLVIQTRKEIELLKKESAGENSNIRFVRIQPNEDELLREKNTLKEIGELVKKMNAIIILEGGVLSHAYYQLLQTGATVEVMDPFDSFKETHEYNKLVRDEIPENISNNGESVTTAYLSGPALMQGLKEKLLEESMEVLDAEGREEILAELADVSEVIDGLLAFLKITPDELAKAKDAKRKKSGGFKSGVVLINADNPLPKTAELSKKAGILNAVTDGSSRPVESDEIFERSHKVEKWSDHKSRDEHDEAVLGLSIPIVRGPWDTEMNLDERLKGTSLKVSGERKGSKVHLEFSLVYKKNQPGLFEK